MGKCTETFFTILLQKERKREKKRKKKTWRIKVIDSLKWKKKAPCFLPFGVCAFFLRTLFKGKFFSLFIFSWKSLNYNGIEKMLAFSAKSPPLRSPAFLWSLLS